MPIYICLFVSLKEPSPLFFLQLSISQISHVFKRSAVSYRYSTSTIEMSINIDILINHPMLDLEVYDCHLTFNMIAPSPGNRKTNIEINIT